MTLCSPGSPPSNPFIASVVRSPRRSSTPRSLPTLRCASGFSDMDVSAGSTVYPLHRCKTVHLVRHAQGIHNVEGEKDFKAYMSPELFDAHLTPLGWDQVYNLRQHVNRCGLTKKIDLVITSPLLRHVERYAPIPLAYLMPSVVQPVARQVQLARDLRHLYLSNRLHLYTPWEYYLFNMDDNFFIGLYPFLTLNKDYLKQSMIGILAQTMQTAVGVFGGESYIDGINVPPLMVENAGNSSRPAISSLNCPPFIAVEYCREHLGVHPCDKRRSITEYRSLFPAIDFSLIESDEDILWKEDIRERNEDLAARGMKFINWLWTRKEKEIAVVTHSGFLYHTLSMYGKDCHPSIKEEISKHFANCELRSIVLIDRSMLGSDPSSNNYPGKIPCGPDLPSDAANEKHPEKINTPN